MGRVPEAAEPRCLQPEPGPAVPGATAVPEGPRLPLTSAARGPLARAPEREAETDGRQPNAARKQLCSLFGSGSIFPLELAECGGKQIP